MGLIVDITKAKTIAHEMRRSARAAEFHPLDELISKQIPGVSAQDAETARQSIRDKYAEMQIKIDAVDSTDKIKAIFV